MAVRLRVLDSISARPARSIISEIACDKGELRQKKQVASVMCKPVFSLQFP